MSKEGMIGKKGLIAIVFCILAVFLVRGSAFAKDKETQHSVLFFFENVCASCHEEDDFYDLFNRCISSEEKAEISYEIRTYNIFQEANEKVYQELLTKNGKNRTDYSLPVLVIDGQWVSGYDNIEKQLHGILIEGKSAETVAAGDAAAPSKDSDGTMELPEIQAEPEENALLLFSTYSCEECSEAKEYLSSLQKDREFVLTELNIAEGNNLQLFKELLKIYGKKDKEGLVPAVFVGNTVLLGKGELEEKLDLLLSENKGQYCLLQENLSKVTQGEEIGKVNVVTLFGAGLLSGFNPCSISMLLMLFSILLTTKASVVKNGLLYLAGKYMTYLGLGAAVCFAASRINQNFLNKFGTVINIVLIALFLFVAVMNFIDFLNVRKQEYGKVRMQLPKGLRRFNHKLLKKTQNIQGIFLGVLVLGLGIAISLGEFFCTGQIYMASILYLLRNGSQQLLPILGTLFVYVTAMSIPAVCILAVIHKTKGTGRVSDFMLKHMGAIKLLNTVLFTFYAVYFMVSL